MFGKLSRTSRISNGIRGAVNKWNKKQLKPIMCMPRNKMYLLVYVFVCFVGFRKIK